MGVEGSKQPWLRQFHAVANPVSPLLTAEAFQELVAGIEKRLREPILPDPQRQGRQDLGANWHQGQAGQSGAKAGGCSTSRADL